MSFVFIDRRKLKSHLEFPLEDQDGREINVDRRKAPDAYTLVTVTQTNLSESEFQRYFGERANNDGEAIE